MYYSTYRLFTVASYVVITGLIVIASALINLEFGILVLIFSAFIGLLVTPLHFHLLDERLDDHHGVYPNPSFGLGMWGSEIIDDRKPSETFSRRSRGHDARPGPICPNCRTVAAVPSAKYCHECGGPFARTSGASSGGVPSKE